MRAINSYLNLDYSIYFYRTGDNSRNSEVDFILYGERGLLAIEIKKSDRLRKDDFTGLKLFKTDYPMAQAYLFYGGEKTFINDDIKVMPLKTFFTDLETILSQGLAT